MSMYQDHPYEARQERRQFRADVANFAPLSPIGFLLRSAALFPNRTAVIR